MVSVHLKSGWAAFQRRSGLSPDGIPGARTLAAVERLERATDTLLPPQRHSFGGDPIRKGVDRDPSKLLPGFAEKVETLFGRLRARGFNPLLWEGYRTPERALELKRRGVGARISMHSYGAAVDIIDAEAYWNAESDFWEAVGEEAQALRLTWGGNWRRGDKPHVQAIPVHEQAAFVALTDAERAERVA